MTTYRAHRFRVLAPFALVLLLAGCISSAGGVTTATVPVLSTPIPTPTPMSIAISVPAIAPTYDVRAHVTTTATPCPNPIGATLVVAAQNPAASATTAAAARQDLATAAANYLAVTPAQIGVPPLVGCNGATGPPTFTAIAGHLTPPPSPPTRPNPPLAIFTPTAPGGPSATFTPTPAGSPGTGAIPATTTATPGPPTPIPTATRVGVPPRFAPISFGGNGNDGGAGIHGITPRNPAAPPDTPTYSEADLRAFVLMNPPLGSGITITATPGYTVARITLTRLGAFNLAFGFPYEPVVVGRSPDTLVYVVELAGQFTMSGGPAPGRIGTFPMCVEVFDARTGNIYIEGGFER